VDNDGQKTPGWRYNFWEMKGVPVRVEVGPKDVEANACVTARRDVPGVTSHFPWTCDGCDSCVTWQASPLV